MMDFHRFNKPEFCPPCDPVIGNPRVYKNGLEVMLRLIPFLDQQMKEEEENTRVKLAEKKHTTEL